MTVAYRLYPDGGLVSEDSFSEVDNEVPYYDDYYQTEVPAWLEDEEGIVCYIENEMRGYKRK
jgi:hypothetical protein